MHKAFRKRFKNILKKTGKITKNIVYLTKLGIDLESDEVIKTMWKSNGWVYYPLLRKEYKFGKDLTIPKYQFYKVGFYDKKQAKKQKSDSI